MTTAFTLAKLARATMKNGKDIAALIESASAVVVAASALLKEAKPVIDSLDTDAITEKARAGARTAADKTAKAGIAAKSAAGVAAGAVGSAMAKISGAKDGVLADLADAKSERELRKAIRDARQSVLENATTTIAISDLQKAAEKSPDTLVGPISDMPGCFVIATYRKLDFDSNLTDYTGIYVGKADNAYEGVLAAISRDGDPDVYADVKYKQNVRAYVFNCLPEDLNERYSGLVQAFIANEPSNGE